MISGLETAGFFLAITLALRFSTWAEGWLTSSTERLDERASKRGKKLERVGGTARPDVEPR